MKEIGEPIEREFMNIDGVKNVYTDGVANVVYSTMEFDMSIKMDEAEQVVRSTIDKVPASRFCRGTGNNIVRLLSVVCQHQRF